MKKILSDRNFLLSLLITLLFLGTGIAFLMAGMAEYSWVTFILLPIVPGIAIGAIPRGKTVLTGALK